MILEIKKLMSRAEYVGEVTYSFKPEKDGILVPLAEIDCVTVTAKYEIFEGEEVEVNLLLTYTLKGQCSYCLGSAEERIEYSDDVLFVTDRTDGDNYYYDGNTLDLSMAVNDALLFSQPKVLLCKKDCKGIKIN